MRLHHRALERCAPVAALASVVLAMGSFACGSGRDVKIVEPRVGVVVDKEVARVSGSCILRSHGVCLSRSYYDENRVTIAACKPGDGDTNVLADLRYLKGAVRAPSDYPIVADGLAEQRASDVEAGIQFACSHTHVVTDEEFNKVRKGQLYPTA